MLDRPITNIYVNGKLEYFMDERISFRGDGFWFIDAQQQGAPLAQNSQFALGPFYHMGSGRLDLGLGLEAGLSLTRPTGNEEIPQLRAQPHIALCAGITWTIWRHIHFFADARYVHARYDGAPEGTLTLDEVIIGGGLGFQLCRTK